MMHKKLLEGVRIVVIEDDITNMAVITVLLKHHGALVIQDFWSVRTIQIICDRLPVDVILLDLMLKHGISGYDIHAAIRKHPDLAHIPVVAVSASDPAVEIPHAQRSGFAGFIGKPIDLHDCPQQIADCIARKPVWVTG